MCLGKRGFECSENLVDSVFHGPFCIIFAILGIIQLSTGSYYYLYVPLFKLLFNAFVGFMSLIIGIVGLIVLCVCLSSVRKYELILYCSTAIIFLNATNLVFLEFGQLKYVFSEHFQNRIRDSSYDLLADENGRLVTSVTALIAVLVGFVEAQITFCCLNRVQYLVFEQRLVKPNVNPEATADLEYVIEKKKLVNIPRGSSCSIADTTDKNNGTGLMGTLGRRRKSRGTETLTRQNKQQLLQKQYQSELAKELEQKRTESAKIEVYTQSWVFKENPHIGSLGSSSSLSISPELSPKAKSQPRTHQRENSELSQTASDRQSIPMSSFSRSVTPISSPVPQEYENRTFGGRQHSRANSDYLSVSISTPKHENNLTLRSPNRLTATLHHPQSNHYHQTATINQLPQANQAVIGINSHDSPSNAVLKRSTFATNARTDESYKSLISELENSLSGKLSHNKNQNTKQLGHYHNVATAIEDRSSQKEDTHSRDTLTACSSSKSSKEGEFSKELELALQLIQELETPSEVNAPMNPKLFSLDPAASEKTFNAVFIDELNAPTTDTSTDV